MPPRNPDSVQLDFPQLTADIIAELRLLGGVGLLDFEPSIRPVYIVSARGGALNVTAEPNIFTSSEIFSSVDAGALAANLILADTGALPAGTYDVKVIVSWVTNAAPAGATGTFDFQHRNAANAANLANVPLAWETELGDNIAHSDTFTYATVLALNERLRFQLLVAGYNGRVGTTIMAARRPVP